MNTEGLCIICSGLGIADEDDDGNVSGYTKTEYCLDSLKDLKRFMRRDDPQRRDVFKQICRWNTVSRDLVPLIEHYQGDRNSVINAVKIMVFLTMPIDPASEEVALQIECLWVLKAALYCKVTIAIIVSLLEEPLGHLENDAFTEDDWKLVQLVLTLFQNILAIQGITVQQKASGYATQIFFYLTERTRDDIIKEQQDVQQDLCGPIASTMNEAMFSLVISKWREASDGVKITNDYKFLTTVGSLMKSMVLLQSLLVPATVAAGASRAAAR